MVRLQHRFSEIVITKATKEVLTFVKNNWEDKEENLEKMAEIAVKLAVQEIRQETPADGPDILWGDDEKIECLVVKATRRLDQMTDEEIEQILIDNEEINLSEVDLEEVLHFVEAFEFKGSPKQVEWARDICTCNLEVVATFQKKGQPVPKEATYWIDNYRWKKG